MNNNNISVELVITDEFKEAFEILENTNEHLFLAGKAGTGKSTFLRFLTDHLSKQFVMLAPTGIAAINIEGQTIHSFFKFPHKMLYREDVKAMNADSLAVLEEIDMIIIDEVSMVRADVMDAIDHSLRLNLGVNKPFGGIQMVLIGDLFQLPPVVTNDELKEFSNCYEGPYFLDSQVVNDTEIGFLEFTEVFRQKDGDFKDILNRIRIGVHQPEDLGIINQRLTRQPWEPGSVTITPFRKVVDQLNKSKLDSLDGSVARFYGSLSGNFSNHSLPSPFELDLKIGCQVMFTKNDQFKRWGNGTVGVVTKLEDDFITVKTTTAELAVEPAMWENLEYRQGTNGGIDKVQVGSYTQFPLQLAWAVSIHKSQGQTFEQVHIDLDRGAFATGQTYVALSRCTSLQGITLRVPVKASDIKVDKRLIRYFEQV